MSICKPRNTYIWVWVLCLLAFYIVWLWMVIGLGYWPAAKEHWPIALTMALGSYAAGATPMGGGTIGFPVLVLLFELPANLGRDFSFAVQSIGMTSASILIFARRQPLAMTVLKGAMLGTLAGCPLGIFFIAPVISELWIKIVFAVVWGSFGLLHLYRINEIAGQKGIINFNKNWEFRLGLILGLFASATVVSSTGVGIDMLVYAALVLLCRADLKIAIPTSVIIMAFASVYGVIIKSQFVELQDGVFENWLAAAPVVVLGAPLGVFIVNIMNRKPTLLFVAVLCVGQFIWTCVKEYQSLQFTGLIFTFIAVGMMLFIFERFRAWGLVRLEKQVQKKYVTSVEVVSMENYVSVSRQNI